MSRNPHPEAGSPATLTDVGYVWECIPCLNANRSRWAKRAMKAEHRINEIRELLGMKD